MSWTIWCLWGAWLNAIALILLWLVVPRLRIAEPAMGVLQFKEAIQVTFLHGLTLMVLGVISARAELFGVKLAAVAMLIGSFFYLLGNLLQVRITNLLPKIIDKTGIVLILLGWLCLLTTLLVL